MFKTARTFWVPVLVLVFLGFTSGLKAAPEDQLAPDGRPWITSPIPYWADDDPNLDPNWDWRQEHYEVYWSRPPAQLWTVASPFSSEYTSGVALTLDYEPEDGWVLVARNFGSEKNYLKNPYFILYNKHTGLLRVFVLLSLLEDHTTGSISLSFDPALSNTTALLTHASNRAWAVDRYKKDLMGYAVTEVQTECWTYADFATAYDPNTEQSKDSALRFRVEGVDISNVTVKSTDFTLTQVLPKSTVAAGIDTYDLKELITDGKHVMGYYNTFQKYQDQTKVFIDKQKNKDLKDKLSHVFNLWGYKNLPYIGGLIGLVDSFMGGGRKKKVESPVPMAFEGHMTLEGTITQRALVTAFSVRTPGVIHDLPNFVPLYDQPLGIFNLRETPVLGHRIYQQKEGPNQYMQFDSLKVLNELNWVVNPYSKLKLMELTAAIVFRLDPVAYPYPYDLLPLIPESLNSGLYEIESSTDGSYVLRTRYMPFYLFRDAVINVPPGTDITIKVKAVLERTDAPEGTQPVLFIADYEPVFQSDPIQNNYPWSPYQLPSFPDNNPNFENGGFEMGLSYWETYGDGDGYGTVEEGVEGDRSAYIARSQATNQFFGYVQRGIPCEPNTVYQLSLSVKTRADSGSVAAGLGNWSANPSDNTHRDFGWTGGFTDWTEITGTWISGPSERSLDIVLYGTPDFSGEAFLDDVYLEKAGPAPLEASIEGPETLAFKQLGTYVADVQHGSGNYSYQWYQLLDRSTIWSPLGTGKIQSVRMLLRDFTLKVEILDKQTGQKGLATIHVEDIPQYEPVPILE